MQTTLTPEQEQEVACPIYYMEPAEEPELHIPKEEAALEQPLLSEPGETEKGYSSNTSEWE